MYDVIVIGGGPAGVMATLRARELGASVALVERGQIGGTCTNDGCVPTRVLAHTARLAREARQFGEYGLMAPPPEIDFARVMARVQATVGRVHEKKQLVNGLVGSGADVLVGAGAAAFLDPHTLRLGDGRELQAEKFIISAGGHARQLPFPGAEYALTHSDIWALKSLPRSVAIVGGAATGSQLGSIFNAFGSQVTLLEVGPRLLGIEDELLSETVMATFVERGVQIITGIGGVERIDREEGMLCLRYLHQGAPRELRAEAIILAVGWPGNVESLNLPAAGVETARGYVQVDDYLRTSAGNIFAAGDITGRMMLVQSASYEGISAAENAILGVGQPQRHQLVPHGGFTDPEYGSVGLTEAKARAAYDVEAAVVSYADIDRAVIDGHTTGYCKLIVNTENHRILGAHVVGEQALEIVQLVAAGMAADIWVEQLADLEISYPTYTAIVGLAARKLVDRLGVRPVSPEWRAAGGAYAAEWERSFPRS